MLVLCTDKVCRVYWTLLLILNTKIDIVVSYALYATPLQATCINDAVSTVDTSSLSVILSATYCYPTISVPPTMFKPSLIFTAYSLEHNILLIV